MSDKNDIEKKRLELNCLDLTYDYIERHPDKRLRRYFREMIPMHLAPIQTERPDFVINDENKSYAIEHFMVDFCYDGPNKNQSKNRLVKREVLNIFNQYHDASIGTIREDDMEAALNDIEAEVNKLADLSNRFEYTAYVEGFRKAFDKHYDRIAIYKQNPEIKSKDVIAGFLIEFHCNSTLALAMYNGSVVKLKKGNKPFPMTKDIIAIFEKATALDFIILSQFHEGPAMNIENVYIFESRNMRKSLDLQHISVYDSVFYPYIKPNVRLKLEEA